MMDLSSFRYCQFAKYAVFDQDVHQQEVEIHRCEGKAYEEPSGDVNIWHIFVEECCNDDYSDVLFTDENGQKLTYRRCPSPDINSARFHVDIQSTTSIGILKIWYGL